MDYNYLNELDKIKKIVNLKTRIKAEILCKGILIEFVQYKKNCRNLEFEQDPNYDYLRSLFTSILNKINQKNDLNFFGKLILLNHKIIFYVDRIKIIKRTNSFQKRLYNKIKHL